MINTILATMAGLIIVIGICLIPILIFLVAFDKLTIDIDMEDEEEINNLNNNKNGNH